jgi:hypothetical protein
MNIDPKILASLTPEARAFVEAVADKRGQFVTIEWESTAATAAAHKGRATKRVRAVTRTGVEYANMAANADRETGSLPWGEWVEGLAPWIIAHKGALYARIAGIQSMTVEYAIDGQPATLEDVRALQTPSQRAPRDEAPLALTIKTENLRAVAGQPIG